ncbi:MAG: hypothetical protein ACOCXA_03735, partial [Planctomycetota bacterium]
FTPVVAFVDRDPQKAMLEKIPMAGGEDGYHMRGILPRAEAKGRMVDAYSIADSYTVGVQNFAAFAKQHENDPDVEIMIINNDGSQPQLIPQIDPAHLANRPLDLRQGMITTIEASGNPELIAAGVETPERVWGPDSHDQEMP